MRAGDEPKVQGAVPPAPQVTRGSPLMSPRLMTRFEKLSAFICSMAWLAISVAVSRWRLNPIEPNAV